MNNLTEIRVAMVIEWLGQVRDSGETPRQTLHTSLSTQSRDHCV